MSGKEKLGNSLIIFIQIIGLVLLLGSLFLGCLYIFGGNLIFAIPLSVVPVICFFYLIDYFIKQKNERTRKGDSKSTILLFLLYTVLSVPVTFVAIHTLNIELNEKEEIQARGKDKLTALIEIQQNYESLFTAFLTNENNKINAAVKKFVKYNDSEGATDLLRNSIVADPDEFLDGFDNSDTEADREEKVTFVIDIKKEMFIDFQNETLDDYSNFINNAENVITNWNRFEINTILEELDSKLKDAHAEFSAHLMAKADGAVLSINIEDLTNKTLIDDPMNLWTKHNDIMNLIIILIFQIFLLLPYLLTPGRIYTKVKSGDSGRTEY